MTRNFKFTNQTTRGETVEDRHQDITENHRVLGGTRGGRRRSSTRSRGGRGSGRANRSRRCCCGRSSSSSSSSSGVFCIFVGSVFHKVDCFLAIVCGSRRAAFVLQHTAEDAQIDWTEIEKKKKTTIIDRDLFLVRCAINFSGGGRRGAPWAACSQCVCVQCVH